MADHVVGPALAAAGEVLAVGDQALVQLTGEHRDAVHPGVMPEPMAGHADLAAAGFQQHLAVEIGPLLNGEIEPGSYGCGPGQGNTHKPLQMRTSVLARLARPSSAAAGLARCGELERW